MKIAILDGSADSYHFFIKSRFIPNCKDCSVLSLENRIGMRISLFVWREIQGEDPKPYRHQIKPLAKVNFMKKNTDGHTWTLVIYLRPSACISGSKDSLIILLQEVYRRNSSISPMILEHQN